LVFAATLRDGANFPGLVVARRSKMPDIRRSSLLDPVKIAYRRCRPNSVNRPYTKLLMTASKTMAALRNTPDSILYNDLR
jgi:hypothetical protein